MKAESGVRHHGAHVHVWGGDDRNATISIKTVLTKKYKKELAINRKMKMCWRKCVELS